MVTSMPDETSEIDQLLQLAAQGDPGSWQALLGQSRQRLHRMVAFRLDQRLQGRVDPSDVLQDAYLEAWQDLGTYMRQPAMPFFLWLRGIAGNKLRELHRHHLGTQMRDPRREVSIYGGPLSETTTAALAAQLLGNLTRASEEAVRVELRLRLQDALEQHGSARPRGARTPAFRATISRRDSSGSGNQGEGRRDALRACAAAAAGDLEQLERRLAGALNMLESLSGSDLLNELAHEFAERYRRGERPPLNEYTDRYPELAGEIRELFPTLVMMEQFGSGVDNPSGPVARRPRVDRTDARASGRLPDLAGDRPGGHGDRLRGGAGESGPAGRT